VEFLLGAERQLCGHSGTVARRASLPGIAGVSIASTRGVACPGVRVVGRPRVGAPLRELVLGVLPGHSGHLHSGCCGPTQPWPPSEVGPPGATWTPRPRAGTAAGRTAARGRARGGVAPRRPGPRRARIAVVSPVRGRRARAAAGPAGSGRRGAPPVRPAGRPSPAGGCRPGRPGRRLDPPGGHVAARVRPAPPRSARLRPPSPTREDTPCRSRRAPSRG
jgi:hypothetical protein